MQKKIKIAYLVNHASFFFSYFTYIKKLRKNIKLNCFMVHMEVKKWKFMLIKKLKVRKLN